MKGMECIPCQYEGMSPNCRLPFMSIQGQLVYGDSIRKWINLDSSSPEEQALLLAIHRKCAPAIQYTLLNDWQNFQSVLWPIWKNETAFPINYVIAYQKRKALLRKLRTYSITKVNRERSAVSQL
jgi:hypothetical protein